MIPTIDKPTALPHEWFSGRILACHAGDRGSIPRSCIYNLLHFSFAHHGYSLAYFVTFTAMVTFYILLLPFYPMFRRWPLKPQKKLPSKFLEAAEQVLRRLAMSMYCKSWRGCRSGPVVVLISGSKKNQTAEHLCDWIVSSSWTATDLQTVFENTRTAASRIRTYAGRSHLISSQTP